MLRHPPITEGQPIGRSASLGKRLGGSPLRIETAAFLQRGCLTRAASGARSKRDGTKRCGDRHVRHPPYLLTAEVPAAREGVESLRTMSTPGPQPNTGSAIRTGWCRRRAVNAVPSGKRFDSVHFPPSLRTWSIGWASECHSVEAGSIPAVRTSPPG